MPGKGEDDDDQYAMENADSGASDTIPMEAGQIKKGGYMMIKGKPCKVLSISVSKTGKHGHAKCNFLATDIFTGKKLEDMIPSTHGTTVPIVNKSEWEIIDIEGDELTLMDEGGNQKTDLNLPTHPESMAEEIRTAWDDGANSVMVTVQSAVGIEQVIGFKKEQS
jgi:translation initiation factor 5A